MTTTSKMTIAQVVAAVDHGGEIEAPERDGADLVYGPMSIGLARNLERWLVAEGHTASYAPDNDDRSSGWVYVTEDEQQ